MKKYPPINGINHLHHLTFLFNTPLSKKIEGLRRDIKTTPQAF